MTPAGWYNDPEGTGQLRWWDGTGWTQHRQPVPQQQMPQQQMPQQQMPQQQMPQQQMPQQQMPQQQMPQQQMPPPRTMIQPGQVQMHGAPPPQWGGLGTTIPGSQSPPQSPLFVLVWLGVAGMAVGPFLNWMTLSVTSLGDDFSTGIKGTKSVPNTWLIGSLPDGYLMMAIAAMVLAAAIAYNSKNSAGAAGWIMVLGIIGVGFAVLSFFLFKKKFDDRGFTDGVSLRPGVGMWVAAVGSILAIVGGSAAKSTAVRVTTQ